MQSAAIQFYLPGPMSRVTSPVTFAGYAVPGFYHKGLIELYGEDGSLLASEILQLNTDYKWAYFSWSLSFEARGAGELGRLSLSTRDQYARLTAVQSVHLLLLPDGGEIINPSGSLMERCVITAPIAGKRISGGTVSVSGEMQPYNDLPLVVELIDRNGTSLGSVLVPILPGQEHDPIGHAGPGPPLAYLRLPQQFAAPLRPPLEQPLAWEDAVALRPAKPAGVLRGLHRSTEYQAQEQRRRDDGADHGFILSTAGFRSADA
jgi:hypothetical protein